ncbi:GNAT family acetyltransferase [Tardiphaga alba]|uniref:GNAT family acetyltransferase n=1 Tax=Tardiphaga alba TaxID=340268 RepID=A0ABX8A4I0_9BRAD|nr:GNAT family acetyltransferase [Tardiphaga alba]QUS38442.1 GNAT family acetyltransferase [Tardiphaga alba]
MKVTPLVDADIPAVVDLWQRCNLARPWNDSAADIALARRDENSDVLVGRDGDAIVASVLVGHDGHRGWVYYVAVDPDHQGKDLGRGIMQAAEGWLRAKGIEKLMLLVRSDNTKVQKFYEQLGYAEQDRVIYAKWLDGRPATP